MSKSKEFVRILNPVHGGSSYTSLKSANKYKGRGLAEFLDASTIRFIERSRRAMTVLEPWQIGYDGSAKASLATLVQVKNLPVVADPMKLMTIGGVKISRRAPLMARPRVIVRDGIAV